MIKILTQKKIRNYDGSSRHYNKIQYAFNFIFDILGLNHEFSTPNSINKNDIVIYYGLDEPTTDEIRFLAQNNLVFFIIADPKILKFDQSFNVNFVRKNTYEVKLDERVPILSSLPIKKSIEIIEDDKVIAYKFGFDIIANVFFQISNYYYFLAEKDNFKRIVDEEYSFFDYKDIPFVNVFISSFEKKIIEGISKRNIWIAKKELWPKGESFGVAITHSIDKLQKWTSLSQHMLWLLNTSFMVFYNWNKLKDRIQIFRIYLKKLNEPYWNFKDILAIQSKKIKSTFFLGSKNNSKDGFDYSFDDEDLLVEIRQILFEENEIAHYGSFLSGNREKLINEAKEFKKIIPNDIHGIRQAGNRFIFDTTPVIHDKVGYDYDSSISFTKHNGFRNGIALPYKILDKNIVPDCLEFQINFSDKVMKNKKLSFENSINIAKDMIKAVKKYNGFITFEFNISNFTEIPYLKKFFSNLINYITSIKGVYLAPLKEVTKWINQRKYIRVSEMDDIITVAFPEFTNSFVLTIYGNKKIGNISYENEIEDNQIFFKNVPKNTLVTIEFADE